MKVNKNDNIIAVRIREPNIGYVLTYRGRKENMLSFYNHMTGNRFEEDRKHFFTEHRIIRFERRNLMDFSAVRSTKDYKAIDTKLCPICKSNKTYVMEYDHTSGKRYGVMCLNCMCSLYSGYAQNAYTAIELWNNRKE